MLKKILVLSLLMVVVAMSGCGGESIGEGQLDDPGSARQSIVCSLGGACSDVAAYGQCLDLCPRISSNAGNICYGECDWKWCQDCVIANVINN